MVWGVTKVNKPEFTNEAFRADTTVIFRGVVLSANNPKIGSLVKSGFFIFVTPEAGAMEVAHEWIKRTHHANVGWSLCHWFVPVRRHRKYV